MKRVPITFPAFMIAAALSESCAFRTAGSDAAGGVFALGAVVLLCNVAQGAGRTSFFNPRICEN